jgi:hypothetical protein
MRREHVKPRRSESARNAAVQRGVRLHHLRRNQILRHTRLRANLWLGLTSPTRGRKRPRSGEVIARRSVLFVAAVALLASTSFLMGGMYGPWAARRRPGINVQSRRNPHVW